MLKLADLAGRADFDVGPLRVSPSRRLVEGPAGKSQVEPIVMKVFLLLLDGAGNVVTRDELFANAWGGVFVGDDSLNRAIARVRKIASETSPGLFEIETIPRTGYRLTGEMLNLVHDTQEVSARSRGKGVSRRVLVGASAAAAVIAAGGIRLWSVRSREKAHFDALMDRGEQALGYGHPSNNAARYFERATAIRPHDANAQGLLGVSQAFAAEYGNSRIAGDAAEAAERAARAALAIDPDEPNARLAQIMIQRATLDLSTTEDRLRLVLAGHPRNIMALRLLWGLLQSAGRSHDAFALIERAIAIEPLAAGNNFPRAQLLWILGRLAEADRAIDRAMQYWPLHPWVRAARFSIFAYTGRASAALAMLDDDKRRPQEFTPEGIALWRISLKALDQRSPAEVAFAKRANVEAAKQNPRLAIQAVMCLSTFGEIDAAFEIANQLLLFRPPATGPALTDSRRRPAKSTSWGFTPWLFTPPAASLRIDPRFRSLCDGIGLTEYWRRRGIGPDAFLFKA